jgi:hypothetical protein
VRLALKILMQCAGDFVDVILLYTPLYHGRNSVVGIATCYGMDDLGIEPRWRRDFLYPSRPAPMPTQSPVQWVPALSRG